MESWQDRRIWLDIIIQPLKKIAVELNRNTNKDIIAFWETVDNKQGLIKQLLHDEMRRQNFVYTDDKKMSLKTLIFFNTFIIKI